MNDIEQQFFKTFGIEARAKSKEVRDGLIECGLYYPKITAEILLELTCLLATVIRLFKIPPKLNVENLKYHILRNCINEREGIKTRVRALFESEVE